MAQEDIDIRINTKLDAAASETDLRKLRGLLKDLQSLGEEVGDTTSDSFKRLQNTINSVEGKIGDASDRLRTISGEPLERVNNGFSLMSEGLGNLDFSKAKIGLDGITEGLGKLNFKELSGGIKDMSGSFLKLGVAIATNPIFLLATTIILIIKNFDKLKAAGGAVGAMFSGIGNAIKFATDMLIKFSDAIGLTSIKQNEFKEANKEAAESTEAYYNTIIDGEIAAAEVMGRSTLALKVEKQQRALDKAFRELREVYKEQIDTEEEFLKIEEMIQSQSLGNIQKYFADRYGSTKEGFDAIAKVYDEWEKKDILLRNSKLKREKDEENRTKENNKKIAELTKDGAQRRSNLLKEDVVNQSKDLQEALRIRKEAIQTEDDNDKDGVEARIDLYKKADKELRDIQKNYVVWKNNWEKEQQSEAFKNLQSANSREANERISDNKEKEKEFKKSIVAAKSNLENVGIILDAARNTLNQKLNAENKKFNEDQKLNEILYQRSLNQIAVDERIKRNQRLQDLNKANFDKQMADDNLNWAQRIDAENGFFKKQEDLLMKSLSLQLQKDGLTEEDKLKLRQEYVLKTEELYKNHFGTVEKMYENSGNNILKNIQSTITELNQMVTDSINTTADKILSAEQKRLSDNESRAQSELTTLKMQTDMTGAIRLGAEKKLIENLGQAKLESLNNARKLEMANVEAGSDEALAIEKKYAAAEAQLVEEKKQQKIQANVETIDKIAAYGASAMEAASLISDLASNKDKERLKKGEITEEQFQKREFNRKKAASIASIVMNTAEAISKAIALSPATGGAPFSIIAAALGALQFAKVTSTTFNYASPAQSTSTSSGSSGASTNRDLAAPGNPYFGQGFLNLNSFNPNQIGGMKVYVLEQDIRNAMNRATVLNNRNML